jgi:hypothetical protein
MKIARPNLSEFRLRLTRDELFGLVLLAQSAIRAGLDHEGIGRQLDDLVTDHLRQAARAAEDRLAGHRLADRRPLPLVLTGNGDFARPWPTAASIAESIGTTPDRIPLLRQDQIGVAS